MSLLADLQKLAAPHDIRVTDRGHGHIQLLGKQLVNYYPLSRRRTAYVDGTTNGRAGVEPKEAILMALIDPSAKPPEGKPKRRQQTRIKKRLLKRTQQINGMYRCWYCPHLFWPDELTVEHLIPVSKGGADIDANKVLACAPCNSDRGNKMPTIPPKLKGR